MRSSDHHAHGALDGACLALCCSRRGQHLSVAQLENEPLEAAQLRDLGVREGAVVTVLRGGNPLLVRVNGARFGIGHAAAVHILCDIIEEPISLDKGTPCPQARRGVKRD
ncbi:MAG TPA: FeoA family protein [Abditibacteriaceae bacterium]|nr:FeoA family protein [Abditibacteriaceae bacterium]